MYPHADDKWICPYIHLLIHTFELQLKTGLIPCKPPRILVVLTSRNRRRKQTSISFDKENASLNFRALFIPLFWPFHFAVCPDLCKTSLSLSPARAQHLFLCVRPLFETSSFSSSSSSVSVDGVKKWEEPRYATPRLKFCRKFRQSEGGNAGWGDSAGLVAVEVRDASECQRRCAEAGKCYHW